MAVDMGKRMMKKGLELSFFEMALLVAVLFVVLLVIMKGPKIFEELLSAIS